MVTYGHPILFITLSMLSNTEGSMSLQFCEQIRLMSRDDEMSYGNKFVNVEIRAFS